LIVDMDHARLRTSTYTTLGDRLIPFAEVTFSGYEVPVENRLGDEGEGLRMTLRAIQASRASMASHAVGLAQAAVDAAVAYAKDRRQFGKPIGKFQAVANKLAEMEVRLESARLVLYKAAWFKAQGKHALAAASMAKLHASEVCVHNCLDAIQIHGGYGYMTEFNVERELRDALAGTLYSGTSEIQKLIIAGLRGL
ncbi:MAG TPA: acyl-CoA dehydrogenase family protein, partial [Candidatus Eisenbacteria bacterium]|nr:acyl-CoA dehydrogenase family protein [Candidatus Eisenbacteria bacterium]